MPGKHQSKQRQGRNWMQRVGDCRSVSSTGKHAPSAKRGKRIASQYQIGHCWLVGKQKSSKATSQRFWSNSPIFIEKYDVFSFLLPKLTWEINRAMGRKPENRYKSAVIIYFTSIKSYASVHLCIENVPQFSNNFFPSSLSSILRRTWEFAM